MKGIDLRIDFKPIQIQHTKSWLSLVFFFIFHILYFHFRHLFPPNLKNILEDCNDNYFVETYEIYLFYLEEHSIESAVTDC